jgi:phosphatidylserine/phosphatidylglycerophosphate/cardiolipin synthase-like enzyme
MVRILEVGRNVWCERPISSVGLLVDGEDYYRAFYEAAQRAERYIVMVGWQFDTDACLLCGEEARQAELPVKLLEFLDTLTQRRPELCIYILAWDFHAVFSLERQWLQELRINWSTNDRLKFMFDDHHHDEGAHHQKFVVIDGRLSFLGGLDLCDQRWDDRKHKDPNPLRESRGAHHKPFHDIQAYLLGTEVAQELAKLFTSRWLAAGGEAVELPCLPALDERYEPVGAVPLSAARVSLSRTDIHGLPNGAAKCREIAELHLDAIARAERLVYIETQYFSSEEIGSALVERLARGPALEVVVVLNMKAETFKEEVAVGLAQAKVIMDLRRAAAGTEHRLGVYYTVPATEDGSEPERATYIHGKLTIVDDRWLTIGSANLTNRSTSVDSELNVSIETEDLDDEMAASIRSARESLIDEHLGIEPHESFAPSGLVSRLDELARAKRGRLRLHPSPTEKERRALEVIDPQRLPFDPSALESRDEDKSIFVGGIGGLFKRLTSSAKAQLGHS